ncbi:MAG: hypothetical protein WC349_04895 [Patescibacteria group bacterium]|jgi:hypothetical protein
METEELGKIQNPIPKPGDGEEVKKKWYKLNLKIPDKWKKITFSKICFALLILFLVFGLLGWQNIKSAKRNFNATADLKGRGLSNQALQKEAAAAGSYGIAKAKVDRFYWQTEKGFEQARNKGWDKYYLNAGNAVLQAKPEEKPNIIQGVAYTEIMLPKENGSFSSDKKIWVETSMFDWVDGGKVTRNEKAIVESQKTTKFVFYTDEEVVVLENFEAGQKIKISGYAEDIVHFRDGSRLANVPPSGVITSQINQPLIMSYKKGGVIYIN